MSLPELPANASRHELRKALIQMRLELHRQELRQEALLALQPLQEARDFGRRCKSVLGHSGAPIAGIAALAVTGLLISKRSQWPRWISLGSALAPLLLALWPQPATQPKAEQP